MTDGDLLDAIADGADAISDLAESRRGLRRVRHEGHYTAGVTALSALMAQYFRRQAVAVLAAIKPNIQSVIDQFREATKTGQTVANQIIPVSLQPLRFSTSGAEDLAYTAAMTALIQAASTTLAEEMGAGEVTAPNFAGTFLRDNSLTKLTGDIAPATIDQLRDAVANAWDEGGSFDQIVSAISETFEDFSEARAALIARTEAAEAYNSGRDATARAIGLTEKSWETESGDPCAVCLANEAQDWIPIDDDFDSGDDGPVAHPNCECLANFR